MQNKEMKEQEKEWKNAKRKVRKKCVRNEVKKE
jgi:hypothetical protein